MRRCDEVVEVRHGRIAEGLSGVPREEAGEGAAVLEGPAQFIWRSRLWRVLQVHSRWVESGEWWALPHVRAARGDSFEMDGSTSPSGGDLLCEQEVWLLEAANGREGSRGVYELAHSWADDSWRLRAVLD